jgi:hypothetical protein
MNKCVKYAILVLLIAVMITTISCAKSADEETAGEEQQIAEPAEEYTPETVDALTNDFNEMEW